MIVSLVFTIIGLYCLLTFPLEPSNACPSFNTQARGSLYECEKLAKNQKFANLPIISGAYCFNNGSYICKAFSGRFEFYFNSKTDEIIRPAEKSRFVDEFGYHERVPVSYNVEGKINYVDRFINWAKLFAKSKAGKKFNILSTKSFNWCAFTDQDWWPYKSSFKWEHYHIYFYNRQSCIFDTKRTRRQHFNTRFLQKSDLRIDLDYNPTIFTMEDPVATENKIRLVKHKRQHWYEVTFDVLEEPTRNLSYFIDMKDTEEKPLKLNGTQGLFTSKTYRNYSNICINDDFILRPKGQKNGPLVQFWCGLDEVEISDLPRISYQKKSFEMNYEVDLHNIPRHPKSVELFYDVHIKDTADWIKFAKDGYTFSATTTIPIDEESVRIIMLVSSFNTDEAGRFNEYYPTPILVDTIGYHKGLDSERLDVWNIRRNYTNRVRDLNYVDDIAYLYKCKSILVILGPLYTELSPQDFSIDSAGYIGPISDLGIYELANAFFNEPDTDILWVYHRTNYVTSVQYSCGDLVKAKKLSDRYYPRQGKEAPSVFANRLSRYSYVYCEECFFQSLEIFKGSTNQPEAPDPDKYPLEDSPPFLPASENDSLFMWIIVGLGVIIILIMAIVCLVTMRSRRRKFKRQKEAKFSGLSATVRSDTSGFNLDKKTRRSSLVTQAGPDLHFQTLRSAIPSHPSNVGRASRSSQTSSSKANGRSSGTARSGLPGSGSRSHRKSGSTSRSKI